MTSPKSTYKVILEALEEAVKKGLDKYSTPQHIEHAPRHNGLLFEGGKKTIEICPTCEGRGFIYDDELTNYHRGEYVTHKRTCRKCGGSGRLERVTHTTIRPLST